MECEYASRGQAPLSVGELLMQSEHPGGGKVSMDEKQQTHAPPGYELAHV